MKLTQQQSDTMKLLIRSPDQGDGWRVCSKVIFERLVQLMPSELIEKDAVNNRCRLTVEGRVVSEWAC